MGVAVFVINEIGRGGPQPKTQFTMPNVSGLTVGLAAASIGMGRLPELALLWTEQGTQACTTAPWLSGEFEGVFVPCWLAIL